MTVNSQLRLQLEGGRTQLGHGGRRKGAGRPNRSGLQAHVRRPRLNPRHPIHVTLRLNDGLPSLRKKEIFKILRLAVQKARSQGLAVAHFAILSNHIHLIVETEKTLLSPVFQSFGISFSKRFNSHLKRSGAVFRERYHLHVLKTPTEVRRALAYVLTNEGKHHGRKQTVRIDPFSSAFAFSEWKALLGRVDFQFSNWSEDWIENWYDEILTPPHTWLLTRGWKKAA